MGFKKRKEKKHFLQKNTFFMSSDEGVQRMSTLLLQGWTMLADQCSIDHFPLMESKREKVIKCPGCHAKFARQTDNSLTILQQTLPPQNSTIQNNNNDDDDGKAKESSSERQTTNESMIRQREQTKQRQNNSKAMGDLLLRGWTMMDLNCPQCNVICFVIYCVGFFKKNVFIFFFPFSSSK